MIARQPGESRCWTFWPLFPAGAGLSGSILAGMGIQGLAQQLLSAQPNCSTIPLSENSWIVKCDSGLNNQDFMKNLALTITGIALSFLSVGFILGMATQRNISPPAP